MSELIIYIPEIDKSFIGELRNNMWITQDNIYKVVNKQYLIIGEL